MSLRSLALLNPQLLLSPAVNLWNLYERSAGETEVMWGLKGRLWRGGSKYEDGPDCDAGAPEAPLSDWP